LKINFLVAPIAQIIQIAKLTFFLFYFKEDCKINVNRLQHSRNENQKQRRKFTSNKQIEF